MSAGVDRLIVGDINICIGNRGQRAVEYLDRLSLAGFSA